MPALIFPYQAPDENEPAFYRAKPAAPIPSKRTDGTTEIAKYLSPSKYLSGETEQRVYFPPGMRTNERRRKDVTLALIVTEGEKKTLAAESFGFICVGLSGTSCWSRRSGKRRVLLRDFKHLVIKGRKIFIVFDSDATINLRGQLPAQVHRVL